jgi:hypothetical protein
MFIESAQRFKEFSLRDKASKSELLKAKENITK